MKYSLKKHTELLAGLELTIETLDDLDRAINDLCDGVDARAQEAVFVEDLCPYFGVVWPAARGVAEHLARMGNWLRDKRVLELGCGLALPSLVAAKLGARVLATDFHPDVPAFLERNMKLNDIAPDRLAYRHHDWKAAQPLGEFDFIIGSDVLYESSHPEDVARALALNCARGSHIVLGDPGRVYLQRCLDELKAMGFRSDVFIKNVRDGHTDRAGDKPTKEVFVIVLQRMT